MATMIPRCGRDAMIQVKWPSNGIKQDANLAMMAGALLGELA